MIRQAITFTVLGILLPSFFLAPPVTGQVLEVHLQFEDDVTDSSGNGRDGAIVEGVLGSFEYVDGPSGRALKLNHDPATVTSDKTEGAHVSVEYTLPEEGALMMWYFVGDLYNYQSLWDTSGNGDDWEMWIYDRGELRGRINSNIGQVTTFLESFNAWYHVAYTWKKGDQAHLFINGVERDLGSTVRGVTAEQFDAAILGDVFFLGGGNAGNTYGIGAFDDFRIYSGAVDEAAIGAIVAEGSPPDHELDPLPEPVLQVQLNFDEDDGDLVMADSSGNGRNGDLILGPDGAFEYFEYIEGPVGNALKLNHDPATLTSDRTDGAYVSIPLTLGENGTILMWYRPAPYYNFQGLWDTSGNADDWEMWIYTDGVIRGRVNGNVGQVSAQLDQPNEWYHLAYTWRRGDQAQLWINGEERDVDSIIRGISGRQQDAAILGDTLFLAGGNAGNTFGVGAFDDVRVYDGPLDEARIQEIFSEGEPPVEEVEAELQVSLKLDGSLDDSSGFERHGSLVEGNLGTSAYVDGLVGQALDLGITDLASQTEGTHVSIPYTLPAAGTIALWYHVDPYYNYQSVWDNSIEGNDWEMWIYNDGRLRARINGGSGDITFDLDNLAGPESWYHIAYAWDREAGNSSLFIDGALVGSGAITTWIEPGDSFFLAGGHPGNTYGVGIFDELRIYDGALGEEQLRKIMDEGMPPAVHLGMEGDVLNGGTLGEAADGVLASGPNGNAAFIPALLGKALALDNDPTASTDGAHVGIPYTPGEQGTIALWYYVRPYYNYQSIWDNSVEANDWEMWVYNDGRLRVRIDAGSGDITYDLDNLAGADSWYHITYDWNRGAGEAHLSINGELVGTGALANWIEPGDTFFLGGGNDGNTYSNGLMDDVRLYDRVLSATEIVELASLESACQEAGDTHVTLLEVTGPAGPLGNEPGTYVATATASDDSGDEILYTFQLSNGADEPIVVGPQLMESASFDLAEGAWTIAVTVDDNLFCDDVAEDRNLTTDVEVGTGCPEEGDTHVTALEVTGPEGPLGQVPGTYTITATVSDDSGDSVLSTFTIESGDGDPVVVGPQSEGTTSINLDVGTWTITVSVDDNECPDEAADATRSVVVEVGPAGVGPFLRGDSNGDGLQNISDPSFTLNFLFLGGTAPTCRAAANANGDEALDISDPTYSLNFLFIGGPPPPEPYPGCGQGLLDNDFTLGCETPTCVVAE